ncbi:TPA_asm: P0 protein [Trachyspermum ammi polerovirus]|uniref:P0 protein n=1 Tax=Trachyspermum ammi polerovirus TaxID=2885089 RepID=A0AAD2QFX9_9VIRU|nr:TPA_asm: P0 protein [Trachyspermum ammi polerovirus]
MHLEIQRSGLIKFDFANFSRNFAYKYFTTFALALIKQLKDEFNVEDAFDSTVCRSLLFHLPLLLNRHFSVGAGYVRFHGENSLRELVLWGLVCGFYPRINKRGRKGIRANLLRPGSRGSYLTTLERSDMGHFCENLKGRPEFFLQSATEFKRTIGVFLQIRERYVARHHRAIPLDSCESMVRNLFCNDQNHMALCSSFHHANISADLTYLRYNVGLSNGELAVLKIPGIPDNLPVDDNEIHDN